MTPERRPSGFGLLIFNSPRRELHLLRSHKKIRMVRKYKDNQGVSRVAEFSDISFEYKSNFMLKQSHHCMQQDIRPMTRNDTPVTQNDTLVT